MAFSRVGAGLWSLCFQFLVAEQIARLGWSGPYSMARDYISDLGSARSPLLWVMNGSFVLQGFLIFFGTLLVRGFFPARPVYRFALFLLAVAGVGVLMVGLVPEDADFRVHILGAVANFLGGNLAMMVLGAMRPKSWLTFAAGSVGLLATLALAFRGFPAWAALGWHPGTVERLAAYPLPLWLTWTGLRMLSGRQRLDSLQQTTIPLR
jgi:hypothetical membrane protein